jgi:hypothetical protein
VFVNQWRSRSEPTGSLATDLANLHSYAQSDLSRDSPILQEASLETPHPPKSLRVERFPIHMVLRIQWLKITKIGSRVRALNTS